MNPTPYTAKKNLKDTNLLGLLEKKPPTSKEDSAKITWRIGNKRSEDVTHGLLEVGDKVVPVLLLLQVLHSLQLEGIGREAVRMAVRMTVGPAS